MLLAVSFGNYLDYLPIKPFELPPAKAAEEEENVLKNNELALIAILVQEGLMSDFDLKARITTYAQNAQSRIPHSKAVIIEVPKNESTFKISSLLEKMYYEGIDKDQIDANPLNNDNVPEDDNQLAGVVLIGDVPLPVVHNENGEALPSVYPYTDFYRKAFIYNHQTNQFEKNKDVSTPTPEVWHGLINPPSKDPTEGKKELMAYFDKNNDYTLGKDGFADFEKRVLYANFSEMEKQMNWMDFRSYERYLTYMEEMVFNRYNKHLLKTFIDQVSEDMGSQVPLMDLASINSFSDIQTETIFKQYIKTFAQSLNFYRSGINEAIKKTGRWNPDEVDSPESLITLRDEYAKTELYRKQLILEKNVNDFVKEEVPKNDQDLEVTSAAKMKVALKILDLNADERNFDFFSHIDGVPVQSMENASQCGIQVGQLANPNQSVLENNSVLANANRLYNGETIIQPPKDDKDWKLQENADYKKYAGCVFNNSIAVKETGNDPKNCKMSEAEASLMDYKGSIEVKANEPVYSDALRCSIDRMTFLLGNQNEFKNIAAGAESQNIKIGKTLEELTNDMYFGLNGNLQNPTLKQKGNFVVQKMLATQEPFIYKPIVGAEITVTVEAVEKKISSLYPHVQPTNEALKAIRHVGEDRVDKVTGEVKFPQITNPSLAADGIRFLSFFNKEVQKTFYYLDLFAIQGSNPEDITQNLFDQIKDNQGKLDTVTGISGNTLEDFFAKNSEILEPLAWKASSIDQKLAEIIPKYVDKNSFMPTPFYNPKKSPNNKPEGYEVLQIIANGDAHGYEFGLEKSITAQEQEVTEVNPPPKEEDPNDNPDDQDPNDPNNPNPDDQNGNFICGDPKGVEIWEWFDALQCWIDEEILPAQDLFALSQSCTAAPLPAKKAEPEEENVFDEILAKASKFSVEMKRRSLVVGQEQPLTISAFNSIDEPLLGYIDMPVHLEMADKSLGDFSENDFYLFAGSKTINFIPKKIGSSQVTIQMGDLPAQNITLNVYSKVNLTWQAQEKIINGRSEFTVTVQTKTPDNKNITDVNDEIFISPEQPADGGFTDDGKLLLVQGKAQTTFYPTPGKKKIGLISKDSYITGEPFFIQPAAVAASQIQLKGPEHAVIGKEMEIEVTTTDAFGVLAETFNGDVDLSLEAGSEAFGTLKQNKVMIKNGKGMVLLQAAGKTGEINIQGKNKALKEGDLTIDLVARVDSQTWKETYPQNLFASFVGFPAGDYSQEDYFGGVHLMSGKTEAVYSFLTAPKPEASLIVNPNQFIQVGDSAQSVYAQFLDNQLLLQVFDQKKMQTLVTKKTSLNFASVENLDKVLEKNKLYWEILDSNYTATKTATGAQIKDQKGVKIAILDKNKIQILDNRFKWQYVNDPEFGTVELTLTDGLISPVRLILNFSDTSVQAEDFEEVNPDLQWSRIYGGSSVNDPTGAYFSEKNAPLPEETREEFYGIDSANNYLSLFASGTNIGEAVKFNLPTTGILLGDPTIRLNTKSSSSLNYNTATGEKIYQDSEGAHVVSINHFNFNHDDEEDVAVLLDDGRVRLLEGGATEPPYKDRGNIALLADGAVALETIDLKKDGYEDLLVATQEGRLAILNNDKEIIHRTDQKINIGKQLKKLFLDDMDMDGYKDLIVLDSRGDLYIFYFDPKTQTFPENGKLLGNYGFSLKNGNLLTDLDVRYANIPEPKGLDDGKNKSKEALDQYQGGGDIDPKKALEYIQKLQQESDEAAQDPNKIVQNQVPTLPWPEGDEVETYFAPIESVLGMVTTKKVKNKDRPEAKNVDLEETLTYTIEISSGGTFNQLVLADSLPDALTFDPQSVKCVQGDCQNIAAQANGVKLFFSNLKLTPGKKIIVSYDAFVQHTPDADFMLQVIKEPNENLNNPNSILDKYKDILVSPPYNSTGKLMIHYTTGPRSYSLTQSNDPKPVKAEDSVDNFKEIMSQMQDMENQQYDEDSPPPPLKLPGMGDALNEATGNNDCYEDPESTESCSEQALDKAAEAISDFGCIGGGCFPMPFNKAFLVPPNLPVPVFAFPTTLPTPVGPMPFVWPGSFVGAASIPGPIVSALRFYVSPTLTGGIGLAMCWGPYPVSPTVPPPVFPIPYPPPIGNCMVTALPVDKIYGGLCSDIENGVGKLMDLISSGVNKVEATINDTNNNPNIPVNIQTGGPDQGAGGLEISLAINLGQSTKFEPPVKSFSNIHIPSFDSLQGVISGWFDRQLLEIKNKLLTLPTFSIYMPDFKSLFTLDFDKTQRRFDGWYNTMNGSAAATLNSLKTIGQPENAPQDANAIQDDLNVPQKIRGGLTNVSGSKALAYTNAIQTQASIYNLNALEGLYDVASTLPLVKLTQKPIEFKVPWLSSAQIQNYIIELQNWIIYYQNEYNRVKDKWEAFKCDDKPDVTDADGLEKNATECVGRKLADAFDTSFDDMIASAKANIEVLQSYMAFPKQLASYKTQLAGYVGSISCYLDVIAQMMGGYMKTIQQEMVAWAETILTIAAVVKNIKELFNVFTNFDTTCDTCMNERYANFGWWSLLGLLLPEIPVIQFPKIPDIVLDLSNIDLLLDLEIPVLNIRPEPIPLPPLPYIKLPDFPNVNLFLQIPALPILPKLPTLPPLPDLPPLPIVDLPTLPPPPKLPDVGKGLAAIMPLLEKILQTWCVLKKSLSPIPEQALNSQIVLLTNRPAYLTPLDILKVQLPKISPFDLGFNEVRIQTLIYVGLKINMISKPLEELSETWNGWIKAIPEAMNEAYKTYLDAAETKVQGALDAAEQIVGDKALEFEQEFDEYVQGQLNNAQGWLDNNIGDPLQEAEKWLKNKVETWNEWAIQNNINSSYQDYSQAINNLYAKTRSLKNEKINAWFDKNRDLIHAMNYVLPTAVIFEFANQNNLGDHLDEALDLVSEKLNEFDSLGPTLLPRLYTCLRYYDDCRVNQEKYFGMKDPKATSMKENAVLPQKLLAQNDPETILAQTSVPENTVLAPATDTTTQMLSSPEGKQIQGLFGDMASIITGINQAEPVDYSVLKEKFGVEDYQMNPKNAAVDKLKRMGEELQQSSEQLLAEAHGLKYIQDLNAIAGVGEQEILPYQMAISEGEEGEGANEKEMVFTNVVPLSKETQTTIQTPSLEKEVVELKQKIQREYSNDEPNDEPVLNNTACKVAVCLPDPNVNSLIPVIPFIQFIAHSEVLFMPKGHLIYSDGTDLYLKRDLTVDEKKENVDNGTPQRFTLSEMMAKLNMEDQPKEAVNMLRTVFTEEGAATFNWTPNNRPDVYGYGIEMKKTATGYERKNQAKVMDEVKIILLPPTADGKVPEAYAGKNKIEFGTLVTSLKNEEEARTQFGIKAQKTVLNATETHFPTINNAQIKVSAHTAVYFDKLQGSAYSLEMENQYQQIRMTWFDKQARRSTYNQNEILAPQTYANKAEPIEVGQNFYYVPLYKEKYLKASDIFVDLAGGYKYYWYIDPDNNNLSSVTGNEFVLGPQKEVKKIKIKLVATKNILDPKEQKFEKTFGVQVYAPEINLSQDKLNEGVIAGDMKSPPNGSGDDLSSIPFSVFRKRDGVWKNLGLLHVENPEKAPTTPPLNDNQGKQNVYPDSYYSINASGGYEIQGFDQLDPSPIVVKDNQSKTIAQIMPGTGKILIFDPQYDLVAVPAGINSPTHIAIVLKKNNEILANVAYLSEKKKVVILNEALTAKNVAEKGVTLGDLNLNDSVVSTPLSDQAPSFPGGAAIFDQTTDKNIAMVDQDGTLRILDSGFELGIKDKNSKDNGYVLQLMKGEQAVFDIFIQANWNKLAIDSTTKMETVEKQIGYHSDFEKVFAPLLPQTELKPASQTTGNEASPFPDVPTTHPFFKQILELYKSHVIDGYGDGTFKPDQKLTRAEFVKIAFGAANCYDCENPMDAEKQKYKGDPFPDVNLPAWYFYCIWLAKELGMVTGYGDGLFRPNQNISRAEAVSVLLRQSKAELTKAPVGGFGDVKGDAWYVNYVYTALKIGLVKETNGLVNPEEQISRGEFAFMAAGLKNYKQCVPLCPCADNPNPTDTDKDGVKDTCDIDIDNDGKLNPLCIFDDKGKLDLNLILKGEASLNEPVDNCIFSVNPKQEDFDSNGIGDMCEQQCACSGNPNQNDTDKDGIPDKCDLDIDNDTVTNPICIFDDSGLLDSKKLLGTVDNCIFNPNTTQVDLNKNGIGDACEGLDLCPGVPEDVDGVADADGCPEVTDNFGPKEAGVYVSAGPLCSLLDYSSDFRVGDTFMTAITDVKTHDIVFSKSKELIYKK